MGCRCCKMIQSYLFDPVQVPSPGYVNEVNSCKSDEEDTDKLKGKPSSEFLAQKDDPPRESLTRTASRGRGTGPQASSWPQQGRLPQGDPGEGRCTDAALNGVGPASGPQPGGSARPPEDGRGSRAGTADGVRPTRPVPQQDGAVRSGDRGAPSRAQSLASEARGRVLQIPAPDYPLLWGAAADSAGGEEKGHLFKDHAEHEPLRGTPPGAEEPGPHVPFSVKRSRDSLNEAVATEVPSVCFEEAPAHAAPAGDPGDRPEEAHGSPRGGDGETADEDAAVAEALAALEAATAGEDEDEAD
ncbi:PREDICTED: uncharacterized protein C4orf19 homolog [Propithecus coquereli]|uniref:Chromosome 4 open reading frame 19 n=1 Tax=Propithecus coquereli TaxID=379532 RepID=A0A2K6F7P9_PROCO|nr:PREDICTED: uncharacterized protein C4orf19 homolog [Propithecus coquereli]XP_012499960.1 PREDICTED: uncharacterized protein C4orf19 homolog [Propithecus coquereli]XP_012499961.1 PREDICTED: uncharacterized protein C4orf19 homolog [Propithecus coquereli]